MDSLFRSQIDANTLATQLSNPYSTSQCEKHGRGTAESRSALFSFAGFTLLATVLLASVLISLAVYNVSLWSDGGIPANSLSRSIVFLQLWLTLLLLMMGTLQFTLMLSQIYSKKWQYASLNFAGTIASVFPVIFTMVYDNGSIFFQ